MKTRFLQLALLTLTVALAAVGCETTTRQPTTSTQQPLSIVFAPAKLQEQTGSETPWYASRNDARLTTYSGYESGRDEVTSDYTYDRQYQYGAYVRDYLYITTYRSSIKDASR